MPVASNTAITAQSIVAELRTLGKESYKRILLKHGIPEPLFGVSVENLKKIQKRIKQDHRLSLDLYRTGIYDAMYLAGLIADPSQMTKRDLQSWVDTSNCGAVCSYTVAGVAAESRFGWEMGRKWMASKKEQTAATGWNTLSGVVAITEDAELDLADLKRLVEQVGQSIHDQPDEVRYAMNGFVIAVGVYVKPLTALALKTGKKMGTVEVDMGDTACKVPYAPDYIRKVQERGTIGKKRKQARC